MNGMDEANGRQILEKYLPPGSGKLIISWLKGHKVNIKFTRGRASKLGDYRSPSPGSSHRITINNDLNPYALLLTLVHEIAHMKAWVRFGKRIKPHGIEWKEQYRELLLEATDSVELPGEIREGFRKYSMRIGATGVSDKELVRLLRKYDPPQLGTLLEELPEGTVFRTGNGRTFRKKEKLRKRYRCELLPSGKIYLFSPLAIVDPLPESPE